MPREEIKSGDIMTNSIFFSLINLGGAIVLYILIVRGLKDKQLKITLITTGGVTKVEKSCTKEARFKRGYHWLGN